MSNEILPVGSRVYVTAYGPFHGLKGTVQFVDLIHCTEDTLCFYLVEVEGALIREPVWFQADEVALISTQEMDYVHRISSGSFL